MCQPDACSCCVLRSRVEPKAAERESGSVGSGSGSGADDDAVVRGD
jgi:hypothetical protein